MLRTLAVPVLAVWAIAGASAWSARPVAGEAVVMLDEVTLRSADTAGAVPALGTRYAIRDTRYAIREIAGYSRISCNTAKERTSPEYRRSGDRLRLRDTK